MLGLGRALGETMAVAIILSVSGDVTFNLISSANPSTIAANIALDFPESSGIDVNALIASGLVLFAITLVVNMAARAVIIRRSDGRWALHERPTDEPSQPAPTARRRLDRRRAQPAARSGAAAARRRRGRRRAVAGAVARSRRRGRCSRRGIGFNLALLLVAAAVLAGDRALRLVARRRGPAPRDRPRGHLRASRRRSCWRVPRSSRCSCTVDRPWPARASTASSSPSRRATSSARAAARYHAIVGTLVITGMRDADLGADRHHGGHLPAWSTARAGSRAAITFFVDVMTGIPSIVAGLFAFALFSIFFGPGVRLGHHGLDRAVGADDPDRRALDRGDAADRAQRPARGVVRARGAASGARSSKVVLPTALAGIVTGVMLAVARVIGETAPLLITTGVVRLDELQPVRRPDAEPAVFAFNEYKNPGRPQGAVHRPRLGRRADADPDRDGAQPARAARLPPLRHRDPMPD